MEEFFFFKAGNIHFKIDTNAILYVNDAANFVSYSVRDERGNLISLDASEIQQRTVVEVAIQPGKATLSQ